MESEPLVGDHWQTDIYAGSSSSASALTPSIDSDPEIEDGLEDPALPPSPKSKVDKTASRTTFCPSDVQHLQPQTSHLGLRQLEEFTHKAYWLDHNGRRKPSRLPELIAIREVLAALLNVGGSLIYSIPSNPNDPVTLSSHAPTLLHKSRLASLSLLSSFLPILSSLRLLRYQSQFDRPTSRPSKQTDEAFSACVLVLIQRFDVFLTSIELCLLNLTTGRGVVDLESDSVISLMRLHYQLDQSGWIILFTSLASVVSDHHIRDRHNQDNDYSTKVLLDKLYQIASHFDSHCNSTVVVEGTKTVFLKTCEPVWRWIGNWIIYGRLPEAPIHQVQRRSQKAPEDEFFIGAVTLEQSNSLANWWEDYYYIKEHSVPEFLQDFTQVILEGGKAPALSRILGIPPDSQTNDWPQLHELVTLKSTCPLTTNRQSDLERVNVLRHHLRPAAISSERFEKVEHAVPRQADDRAPTFALDLHSRIGHHLLPLITLNHSQLHSQFFSLGKLTSYLSELNEFFLLGSNASVLFLKKIFEEAQNSSKSSLLTTHSFLNSTNWWEEQVINGNLSKALECFPSPIISSFLPKIKSSPLIRAEEDPIKCLEMIEIFFTIPTPSNYVLDNAHVMKNYNKCFVFLTQLAWAAWTLDGLIWVKPVLASTSSASSKEFEKTAESKEFYRLKNRLAWFVNLMTDYCMNLVILKWKTRVIEALNSQVGNLSQTILCTRRWLERLAGLMFLSEECRPLNQLILNVLRLCTKSHETWTAFNRRAYALRFFEDISETYINIERQKRRIKRRKRRMQNEQYALIDEESRYIDLNEPIDSNEGVQIYNEKELGNEKDDGRPEHPSSPSSSEPLQSFSTTVHQFSHLMINTDGYNYLVQFQKMNLEFEKLLTSFQRGVGKLCRKSVLWTNNEDHHQRDQRFNQPSPKNDPIKSKAHSVLDLEGSEDLDILTLLECRLAEWIV